MAKHSLPASTKKFVAARANGCCEYCFSQAEYATHPFSVDHIQALSKGGTDDLENLAYCCQGCNNFKFSKSEGLDPQTNTVVTLYNPRVHEWSSHFRWNENATLLIGISPVGRATAVALRLNRPSLVKQRAIYTAYGIHPPTPS
jgi:hypothetical protein